MDMDYLLITIPTQFVKETLEQVKPLIKKKITVINAAKGFDLGTNMRMSDTIRSVLDENLINPVVSLIGPSHAEEVVVRMLTTCLLYTSPSPRDRQKSRMPSSA